MFRPLLVAALALVVASPPAPAPAAQDELVRQLVNACVGCRFPKDLRGRDLHGLHFVAADLRDADFSRADLSGAEFTGADLAGARFDDADLRNARFVGVEFRGTSFARAKLDGVTMRGVQLGADSIVGADYHRFLRDCNGCDVADLPRGRFAFPVMPALPRIPPTAAMPPEVARSLRDLERQLREHPPVVPRELIERSVRDAQRALRDAQRASGDAERAARMPRLVAPPVPTPPLPTLPPLPASPAP